jgi:modulator of FtsH protease HflC
MTEAENKNPSIDDPQPSGRASTAGWIRRGAQTVLVAGLLTLAATSVIFVDETESVIVERFGNIVQVYDHDADRGAHFKLPWPIDLARRFDRRVQLFDPPGREMFTSDKKNVTVDVYVCWKVAEPAPGSTPLLERPVVRFYRGLGSVDLAEARLDSRVRSILTTAIGQVELSRLLGVKNSEQGPADKGAGPLERLSETVRDETMRRGSEAESLRDRLGIEIVDLRITRLNLPTGNQQAVFERMKSERKKIADRYRSAGMAENQMIHSQADRQYNEILAKTRADAERIRGTAEAEAVRVLNAAHSQDPEFYRVLTTLDAYRKILNEKTTLVLSASSSLLKMFTEGVPELKAPIVVPPGHSNPPSNAPNVPNATTKAKQAGPPPKISSVQGGRR